MKGNLLIVDDEPMLTDSLKFIFRHTCENIFIAGNGLDAIAIIDQHKVHCVLTDFQMPSMSGLELFKTVRKSHDSLPFIFFTGHESESILHDLKEFRNFEVIAKPSLDKLQEQVKRFTGHTY